MAETLEWFQCKGCGRRHRWQADIAGTEIDCQCGAAVLCPEVEVFAGEDPSDTVVDPSSSAVMRARRSQSGGQSPASGGAGAYVAPAAPRTVRMGGLTPFMKALLWSIGAAVGFILLVHALVVQTWWYIALTVLWTPFSFMRFLKARKKWQGNRSLKRAFLEQMDAEGDEPD